MTVRETLDVEISSRHVAINLRHTKILHEAKDFLMLRVLHCFQGFAGKITVHPPKFLHVKLLLYTPTKYVCVREEYIIACSQC